MRNGAVARQFENVEMARDVRVDIGRRIFERIAYAGLGAEVNNPIDLLAEQAGRECACVAKVDVQKAVGCSVLCLETRDARALEVERIIGREIVDSNDLFAAIEQGLRDVHTDKASCTSDERRQPSSPIILPPWSYPVRPCLQHGRNRPVDSALASQW